MSTLPIFAWAIEDIVVAHPNLYLEHCVAMAVALMARQTVSPCEFTVECSGLNPLLIRWSSHSHGGPG